MYLLHEVPHGMQWILFHGLLEIVSSSPQRGGSNTKLEDPDTFEILICVEGPTRIEWT